MLHFKLLLYLSLVIAYGLEFHWMLHFKLLLYLSLVIAYGLEPLDAPFQTVAVFITSHCIWFRV